MAMFPNEPMGRRVACQRRGLKRVGRLQAALHQAVETAGLLKPDGFVLDIVVEPFRAELAPEAALLVAAEGG